MTDSPYQRHPVGPQEQPVLDATLEIRDKLLLLKQDKTKYVQAKDVFRHYDQIMEQFEKFCELRANKNTEQTRLDTVMDDCLHLISLFYMTVGHNAEAPATYSVAGTIKRLLQHLKEAGFFTGKDLESISWQLDKIRLAVENGANKYSSRLLALLSVRVDDCEGILAELKQTLSSISPELVPTHEKLVSILRSMSGLNLRKVFPVDEAKDFQKQLQEIQEKFGGNSAKTFETMDLSVAEEKYIDKLKHMNYGESAVPGEQLVKELVDRCLLWAEISLHRRGKIDERFRDQLEKLTEIKNALERLSLTQAWSLRETDLYSYQRQLDRADESRVDHSFVDASGKPADLYEQRAMLYLLRRNYANIFFMITTSEPVCEALLPIYNQLMTLRKCLVEVKRSGGLSSARELYPYSMKLSSIDNMRQGGKFVINGDCPDGQNSVTALLSECFELTKELHQTAEARDEDEDEDSRRDGHSDDDAEEEGVHMTHRGAAVSIGVK